MMKKVSGTRPVIMRLPHPANSKETDAMKILEAGMHAASPYAILRRVVRNKAIRVGRGKIRIADYKDVRLVSFGKAGLSMALAFDSMIRTSGGIIVMPRGIRIPSRTKFEIVQSTHPNPSNASVTAARKMIKYIEGCESGSLVVFLVSGGASALVSLPWGVSLADKISMNKLLLRGGAHIGDINCVRKHLSGVKGGKVIVGLGCDAVALLMSDVKANDMSAIASGMTYCDKTTFAQARNVIKKYGLEDAAPPAVIRHLEDGVRGRLPETPKKPRIRNYVIASNRDCINAMASAAKRIGYTVRTSTAYGKIEKQAGLLARAAPGRPGTCLIFGGETTVLVRGRGRGGRNQEMVLQIARRLRDNAVVGAMGTDGIDGNTESAGALISTGGIDKDMIKKYLKSSNSHGYFKRYGGLINTGPTQTNLLDIGMILC